MQENQPPVSTRQPSRRHFLKTAAASTLAAALPISRSAYAAGGDDIKVGLIGSGGRGSGAAMDAMKADPGVRLVAMADLFASRIQENRTLLKDERPQQMLVDDAHCFVGFDGWKHVIECSDVVLIACASRFHPYYLKAAIEAGKHVFVEKPHGIDPVGVRVVGEACELARRKKLSVLSGLHNRFDPAVQETVQRIHDGAIGEVTTIEGNFLRAPYRLIERLPGQKEIDYQYANWYHFTWLSGDDVIQSLVHNMDKACWILHEATPAKAHGLGGRSASFGEIYGDVFDHHSVIYEYERGAKVYAFCRTQVNCHSEVSDVVFGTKGRCDVLKHRITGENPWQYRGPVQNPYEIEHQKFFAAIRADNPLNCGSYMGHSTMMVILGQLACYTGKQLSWEDVANSNFRFGPAECDFNIEPPVKADSQGNYPVAVPGITKLS